MMFKKILVANRGEIACRVIRACRGLGIKTVAIYSERDEHSLHVKRADEKYCIGPPDPIKSYLDIDRIIAVALESGAEAIHPGYGFRAEDPSFVKACEKNEIEFIGPSSSTMERLGNKPLARKTMEKAGIPVIPGSDKPIRDEDEAKYVAEEIGYPVLIKALYGGGGKGMRLVQNQDEMELMLSLARDEANRSFGRTDIYLEKYIQEPRHIEFQTLADKYGNVIHLGERECSVQRRYQKLLEECPSPALDEELRKKMGETAIRAIRAGNYVNVGTVEFLLDKDKKFYFLEINKRVQVEHLITELVTRIDIVKEGIRIAAGEKLGYEQKDVEMKGWAMNCRINSEDPSIGFLPCPGKVIEHRPPEGGGIRVDTALYSGYEIPGEYDSLVSKLAVWGESRRQAIERMKRALKDYKIEGVKTTIPFHLNLLEDKDFVEGNYDTHLLQKRREYEEVAAVSAALVAYLMSLQPRAVIPMRRVKAQDRWKMAGRRKSMRRDKSWKWYFV